jgi:hypothetical protein
MKRMNVQKWDRRWDSPDAKLYRTSAYDKLNRGSQAGRNRCGMALRFLPNVFVDQ